MWFVYILKSKSSEFIYIGSTNDLDRRLQEHNDLKSQSTKSFAPFEIIAYVAVSSEAKARNLKNISRTVLEKPSSKKESYSRRS